MVAVARGLSYASSEVRRPNGFRGEHPQPQRPCWIVICSEESGVQQARRWTVRGAKFRKFSNRQEAGSHPRQFPPELAQRRAALLIAPPGWFQVKRMLTEEQAAIAYEEATDGCRRSVLGARDNARQSRRVKPDPETNLQAEFDHEKEPTRGQGTVHNSSQPRS